MIADRRMRRGTNRNAQSMSIGVNVRVYEELNDYLPPERRKVTFRQQLARRTRIGRLLEIVGIPASRIDLLLLNGESVGFGAALKDGDRISVYPVFEALNISAVARLPGRPLREPRFLAEPGLEALSNLLRRQGFDVLQVGDPGRAPLAEICRREHRILLTRSPEHAAAEDFSHLFRLTISDPKEQLAEVVRRLDLKVPSRR
jgi:hypothetical protein